MAVVICGENKKDGHNKIEVKLFFWRESAQVRTLDDVIMLMVKCLGGILGRFGIGCAMAIRADGL